MNARLSSAQQYMLDTLHSGAYDDVGMMIFGRMWRRVWQALDARGLVRYRPYSKFPYQVAK